MFWYEEINHLGLGELMTAKVDGSNLRTFFNNSEGYMSTKDFEEQCNCPENPQISKSFVIDLTNNSFELYYIDPWVNNILVTDKHGCKCRVVVNATEKKKYGFPPMSMTVDSKQIYWYNSTEKLIYYTDKFKKNKIEQVKSSYGYKIMALDPGRQPYPSWHCLFPTPQKLIPKVLSHSADSIRLEMPNISKPVTCEDLPYNMAATEYTIFYKRRFKHDTNTCDRETCSFIVTTKGEVILNGLKPFTNYTVIIEATNYYGKLHEIKPVVGAAFIVQTAAEGKIISSIYKL